MKILLLTNLFPPFVRGGAERLAECQADLLARAGHQVTVLTPCPDGRLAESVLDSGVHVYRFCMRNVYFTLRDFAEPFWKHILWHVVDTFHPYPKRLVRRVIASEKPDLVITHNMKGFGLTAFSAIRASGVHHVHMLHDIQLVVPSGLKLFGHERSWQASGVLHRLFAGIVRRRIGSPDVVVAPTRWVLSEHEELGFFPASRKEILSSPVRWEAVSSALPSSASTPSQPSPPVILFVGQLSEHKGIRTLLSAWDDAWGAELGFIGSGPLEKEIAEFASHHSRVTLHGQKSPKVLQELLSKASLVVVPSLCYENAPNVIIETLSLGTPVVASRIGGIPELLESGDGTLVEPGNVDDLRSAIARELASPRDRKNIQSRAERFSLETYKQRFLKFVEGLNGTKRS